MPNQRRKGWVTRSWSTPLDEHEAAKAEAAKQGHDLSSVIREALRRFTRGEWKP